MKWLAAILTVAAVAGALAFAVGATEYSSHKVSVRTRAVATETIYLLNRSSRFISDKEIKRDIPAWEKAANGAFAASWGTPHVKLVLADHAPAGSITATFRDNGPVTGALAYHTVQRGVSSIIVYAGVGVFYGYSNSVSFTHELFELLADQNINSWNWHWQSQSPAYYIGQHALPLPLNSFWFNEVCDPVEAYSYSINRVAISDWITPNWFNDQVNGSFDEMNLVHEPLQTLKGGYSQFMVNGQYNLVQDFRGAGKDADGFYRGEKVAGS